MEDIKEILKSICITDEDVKKVVTSIREDIIPKFKGTINMVGEKILVRKVFIKESEKTSGGIIITEGKDKSIKPVNFYTTHPFQGVVIGISDQMFGGMKMITKETMEVNIGDHILCKSEIITDSLIRGGVIIDGYSFGYVHSTDIICIKN